MVPFHLKLIVEGGRVLARMEGSRRCGKYVYLNGFISLKKKKGMSIVDLRPW